MSPSLGLSPTPSAWNTPASTGVTPKPTLSPAYQRHDGLLRRDTAFGRNTCGWINGDQNQPFTCDPTETCVADAQYTAFGCCPSTGDCYNFVTACIEGQPICVPSETDNCSHYYYTIGCEGGGGCVTYVMPGAVPFSSFDCIEDPGLVDIQTTYAGGPAGQVPMPLSQYLVAASTAVAVASSSAAQASATGVSGDDDSSDDTSDWLSAHKTLLIGAIVGGVVFLLLCCCGLGMLRRKRRDPVKYAPAAAGMPPPQYNYGPPPGMQGQGQGQENYPMMHYQYGPNK